MMTLCDNQFPMLEYFACKYHNSQVYQTIKKQLELEYSGKKE